MIKNENCGENFNKNCLKLKTEFKEIYSDFKLWLNGLVEDDPIPFEIKSIIFFVDQLEIGFSGSESDDVKIIDFGTYFPLESQYFYSKKLVEILNKSLGDSLKCDEEKLNKKLDAMYYEYLKDKSEEKLNKNLNTKYCENSKNKKEKELNKNNKKFEKLIKKDKSSENLDDKINLILNILEKLLKTYLKEEKNIFLNKKVFYGKLFFASKQIIFKN